MKEIKIPLLLTSCLLFTNSFAAEAQLNIENATSQTFQVLVINSNNFNCQLQGQKNFYDCGNTDGNAENPPGALNTQFIQPYDQFQFTINQKEKNNKNNDKSILAIGLRSATSLKTLAKFTVLSDANSKNASEVSSGSKSPAMIVESDSIGLKTRTEEINNKLYAQIIIKNQKGEIQNSLNTERGN